MHGPVSVICGSCPSSIGETSAFLHRANLRTCDEAFNLPPSTGAVKRPYGSARGNGAKEKSDCT